mgnify:CR=1 FL=1
MHQQKGKKIFFYFFLLILVGSINNFKFDSSEFIKIKTIKVSGLDKKNNKNISLRLVNLYFQNIFTINSYDLIKKIESNKLIEKYKITKIYPSTIDIKLKKTNFLAKLKKEEKIYVVGTNGKLLDNNQLNLEIPFIFGNPQVEQILELKKIIDKSEFSFSKIKNLYYFQSKRWDMELENNTIIKLPKENINEAINLIVKLMKNKNLEKVKVFDARIKNQIILND